MAGHARGRCDNKSKAEGGDRRAGAGGRAASLETDTRRMKKKLPSRRSPLLPRSVDVALGFVINVSKKALLMSPHSF